MILITGEKAACMRCGYKLKKKPKIQASEKVAERKEIPVVKEEEITTEPVVEITCPKCKNDKAYFWTTQTRGADESETKFYKCTKCKHTWRVYR